MGWDRLLLGDDWLLSGCNMLRQSFLRATGDNKKYQNAGRGHLVKDQTPGKAGECGGWADQLLLERADFGALAFASAFPNLLILHHQLCGALLNSTTR